MQVYNKEFALEQIYKYTYSLNTVPLVMMPRSPAKKKYCYVWSKWQWFFYINYPFTIL